MMMNLMTNRPGGEQHPLRPSNAHPLHSPEWKLWMTLCQLTTARLLYEQAPENTAVLKCQLARTSPSTVARMAIFLRYRLRQSYLALVLLVELARLHRGDDLVRRLTQVLVRRPEDLLLVLELVPLANHRTGPKKLNRLSAQLRKGLRDAFEDFKEDQFRNCLPPGEVRLRDAMFLLHPKPGNTVQEDLFDRIAAGDFDPHRLEEMHQDNFEAMLNINF